MGPPLPHLVSYISAQLTLLGYKTDPCLCRDQLVTEVAYAYAPPVHEQRCFSFGAIILSDDVVSMSLLKGHFEPAPGKVESGLGRILADGKKTFLIAWPNRLELWRSRKQTYSTEVDLFFLRDNVMFRETQSSPDKLVSREMSIVKRDESGGLTVMNWDGIFQHKYGSWTFRQYQYAYRVEDHLASHFRDSNSVRDQLVRSLLKVAVHILSPAGIGTTFVMKTKALTSVDTMLNSAKSISPPDMSLLSTTIHSTFAHIASQMDGAVVVSSDGTIESMGAMLNPGESWIKKTSSLGGARQLSAQAFSLACAEDALVITVSADGPVRAFFLGMLIENTPVDVTPTH